MNFANTLKRAQHYLEALDDYKDPISGAPLPGDSAAFRKDLHFAFFFTAKNLAALAREAESGAASHVKDRGMLQERRDIMAALSQGADPATGALLPDHDPLTQPRLKACFGFVAEALDRALAYDSYCARCAFDLPQELRDRVEISREPQIISAICRRISSLRADPTAMLALTGKQVVAWLHAQGLLQREKQGDHFSPYFPTEAGRAIGMIIEPCTNSKGDHCEVILYTAPAQQYLLDRLDEIIEFVRR